MTHKVFGSMVHTGAKSTDAMILNNPDNTVTSPSPTITSATQDTPADNPLAVPNPYRVIQSARQGDNTSPIALILKQKRLAKKQVYQFTTLVNLEIRTVGENGKKGGS
jgi:hypothetical protein